MRITHISNSFMMVEGAASRLVCDPWVGTANHGGWRSYPEYDRDALKTFAATADVVYISHLHSDHFDPQFLSDAGLLSKRFVIKQFSIPTLKRRLQTLGVTDILELAPWTPTSLCDGLEVAIIPQLQSSNTAGEGKVGYDLDTSIVMSDGQTTFFNQVDNPLSVEHLQCVKDFISSRFGTLHVAAVVCGAASEYPQCFLNIDRQARSEAIIDQSLEKLVATLGVLSPRVAFLAGGAYFIPGANHHLNPLIAQPGFGRALSALAGLTPLVDLEAGMTLTVEPHGGRYLVDTNLTPTSASLSAAIAVHADDLYPHEWEPVPDPAGVQERFERARTAYLVQPTSHLDACIEFRLYDGLTEERARNHQDILSLTLGPRDRELAAEHHVIHMDIRAFDNCVARRQSWNQTLSGSLCLFERTPDIHTPEVLFSLNHLVAPREAILSPA